MSGELVIVRHADTAWTVSGQHTGRSDIPLNEEGRAKALGLREPLSEWTFVAVWSSPLSRALETARLAGFAPAQRAQLLEWDYGDYDGRTTLEIRDERPGWTLWADGVPKGELAASVGRRADRVIERAREGTGDTLCFAHGHLLRVLASRWVGLPPMGGRLIVLDAAAVGELGWEREVPVIARWNEPSPG